MFAYKKRVITRISLDMKISLKMEKKLLLTQASLLGDFSKGDLARGEISKEPRLSEISQ